MCTLTWNRSLAGDLEVYFNRDELKTRPVADPPAHYESGATRFVSPRDPKGSGTWMLANDHGLVVCLLNKWELEGREIESPQSRGRLVWSMAGASSLMEVGRRLSCLESYQAFTLTAFSKDEARLWEWDGQELNVGEVPDFLTSSSYRFEEVKSAREGCFASGRRGNDFHASTDEMPSAYSVRMNRPDAQTWSRSHLILTDRISWTYLAEQPGLSGSPEQFRIELPLK